MLEIAILVYFLVTGLITHISYQQYQGKIGIVRCFVPAALFPLIFLNAFITLVLSFIGVMWVLQIGYIMTEDEFKSIEQPNDKDDRNLQ